MESMESNLITNKEIFENGLRKLIEKKYTKLYTVSNTLSKIVGHGLEYSQEFSEFSVYYLFISEYSIIKKQADTYKISILQIIREVFKNEF